MALNLSTEALAPDSRRQQVITGVWACRESERSVDYSEDAVRHRMRSGTFRACQELTSQGYFWRIEVLDKSTPEELQHESVSVSGIASRGSRIQEVKDTEYKELMAALKEELDDRYGQIHEMHVLFQQMQALPLRWQNGEQEPWWSGAGIRELFSPPFRLGMWNRFQQSFR